MAGGDRSRGDAALVVALAGGNTMEDAATTVGVGVATVYRRLQVPEFRTRIDDARAELIATAVARAWGGIHQGGGDAGGAARGRLRGRPGDSTAWSSAVRGRVGVQSTR